MPDAQIREHARMQQRLTGRLGIGREGAYAQCHKEWCISSASSAHEPRRQSCTNVAYRCMLPRQHLPARMVRNPMLGAWSCTRTLALRKRVGTNCMSCTSPNLHLPGLWQCTRLCVRTLLDPLHVGVACSQGRRGMVGRWTDGRHVHVDVQWLRLRGRVSRPLACLAVLGSPCTISHAPLARQHCLVLVVPSVFTWTGAGGHACSSLEAIRQRVRH